MKRKLPPLNAVKAFESAARNLSVNEAAEELSVTPTAVSHQLKRLEEALNVKLYRRKGRAIELTEHGKNILPTLTDVLDSLSYAFEDMLPDENDQTISLSTTNEFAQFWLSPRLHEFYDKFPDYTVNIFTSEQCSDLDSSDLDLCVRYGHKLEKKSNEYYLFQEHYVATSIQCGTALDSIDICDIPQKRLIEVLWEKSVLIAPTWKDWFNLNEESCFDSFTSSSIDSYILALDAISSGHGSVALLSETIYINQKEKSKLIRVTGKKIPGYHYRIICSRSSQRKKAVTDFIDWLLSKRDNKKTEI